MRESLVLEGLAKAAFGGSPTPFCRHSDAPRRASGPKLMLHGAERSYEAGATIYAQSDPAEFIYQVTSGAVRTITLRRDGRRTVHGFHLSGEIFGLERDTLHHCSAEAIGRTRLVQSPVSRLNALTEHDKNAAHELWMSMLLSRDRTAERFMHVMHGTAFEKLAYFLIDLARRTRSEGCINLPMSRYDIADYLGLSSETVSRTFTAFRTRGLISTKGRQVLLLSDEILHVGESWNGEGEAAKWSRAVP
jgi:CRP/FNR family nitrogen fixation transcriptional regulator